MISADSPLESQLNLLQAVVKAVKVGAIVLDADQRVVFWNQWMSQHSPFNGEAALGKTFVELFPDLENGRTHGAIHAALTSNFASLISQTLNKAPFPVFASPADAAKGNRM